MHLWQLEREADRCGRHHHQLQQVLAEILATLSARFHLLEEEKCWN